jgi:hypothetical protein
MSELSIAMPLGVECIDLALNGEVADLLFAKSNGEEASTVYHTRSRDSGEGWTLPVRVDEAVQPLGGNHIHMWSGPQLAAHGDDLMALWTSRGDGFMGRGPLATSISTDGGLTWAAGTSPVISSDDGAQAFPDLVVDSSGVFHAIWLERRAGEENKSLLYSRSDGVGRTWSVPMVADEAACECCWNRIAIGPGGDLYALYRDINPRDMSIATLKAGAKEWSWLGHTGAFDWDFNGCPHVGGGLLPLAGKEDKGLHAIVWTGKEDVAGVYYLRSQSDGEAWASPSRVGNINAVHADLAGSPGGILMMAWDSRGVILWSVSNDQGVSWSNQTVLTGAEEDSDTPAVVRFPGGFRVFWFTSDEGGSAVRSKWFSDKELSGA